MSSGTACPQLCYSSAYNFTYLFIYHYQIYSQPPGALPSAPHPSREALNPARPAPARPRPVPSTAICPAIAACRTAAQHRLLTDPSGPRRTPGLVVHVARPPRQYIPAVPRGRTTAPRRRCGAPLSGGHGPMGAASARRRRRGGARSWGGGWPRPRMRVPDAGTAPNCCSPSLAPPVRGRCRTCTSPRVLTNYKLLLRANSDTTSP